MRAWALVAAMSWGWTALSASGAQQPVGQIMLYNAGPSARTGVALGSLREIGLTLPGKGFVVRDGDKALPAQVSDDLIAVLATLRGYEHKRLTVFAGAAKVKSPLADPLRHSEDKAAWMTYTKQTELRIDKKRKGITRLKLGGVGFNAYPSGYEVWVFPPTYDSNMPDPWRFAAPYVPGKATDVAIEVLATGPLVTRYRITWSCPIARVEQVVTLTTGARVARFDVKVTLVKTTQQVLFGYHSHHWFDQEKTVFYPLGRRVIGNYDRYKHLHRGQYDKAPGWVMGWSPKQGGLGFAVTDRGMFSRLAYGVRSPADGGALATYRNKGKTNPAFHMTARSESLEHLPAGTSLAGTVWAFIAPKPADAAQCVAIAKSPLRLRKAAARDVDGVVQLPATPLPVGQSTTVKATLRGPKGAGEKAVTASVTPEQAGPHVLTLGSTDAPSRLRYEAQPVVAIEKVWPDKVLYANNAQAKCDVVLKNWQDQPTKATLVLTLHADVDRQETIKTLAVDLKPLERRSAEVTWNTGQREYGHEIRAVVRVAGQEVDRASEYFAIATDWLKVTQDGNSRYYYHNCGRYHNVQREDGSLRLPNGDYKHRGHADYYMRGDKVREDIAAFKQGGKKALFYLFAAATPWGSLDYARDPRKILYRADGHPGIDYGPIPNLYAKGFRDWLVDEIDWAIRNLGWDGVFLDVSQAPPQYAGQYYDWRGRSAGTELGGDPDSIGAAWFADVVSRVKKKHPTFVTMHNPEVFKSEFRFPKSYAAAGRVAMIEMGGGGGAITNKSNKYGQWASLIESYDSIRRTKRRYGVERVRSYVLGMVITGGDTCIKTLYALYFASGFSVASTGNAATPAGCIHGDAARRYMQFVTRYASLVYHDAIRWVLPEDVTATVDAPKQVRWKTYVYERDLPDEKDTIIHLVQMSPDKYVFRRPVWQKTIEKLKATMPVPAGCTLRDVWLLSPDRATRAEKLPAAVRSGRVRFTIPDLTVYDIVVVRFAKKGGGR